MSGELVYLTCRVNGEEVSLHVRPEEIFVDVLRDRPPCPDRPRGHAALERLHPRAPQPHRGERLAQISG